MPFGAGLFPRAPVSGPSGGPDFRGLGKSLVLSGRKGRSQEYPTRADYLEYLVREGYVRDEADFIAQPELVARVHEHWHRLGQQGCRFAVFLGNRPVEHGWGRIVVPGTDPAAWEVGLWRGIAEGVDTAIRRPAAQALSLLFPGVTTEEPLVGLVERMESRLGWTLLDVPEPAAGWGAPEPVVGVAFRIPLNKDVLAWPIGLGPFDFLPATRRSPLTEIILVTKPKRYPLRSERITDDPHAAHLADMPVNVEDEVFERLWVGTQRHKAFVLGDGGDPRAKAKVSFVLPSRLWRRAGETG